jgi:hypothetical protein
MGRELSQGEERRGGGGLGRWQQGDDEARKTKECGGGGGAERPNYRLGKWKAVLARRSQVRPFGGHA